MVTLFSIIFDILLVNAAELLAIITRFGYPFPYRELMHYQAMWFLITMIRIWALYSNRVYENRIKSFISLSSSIIQAVLVSSVFIVAVTFFNRTLEYSRLVILYGIFYAIFLLVIKYYIFWRHILIAQHKKRVLIIGANEAGRNLIKESQMFRHNFWEVAGFLDNKGKTGQTIMGEYKILGNFDQIKQVKKRYHISLAIVALPSEKTENKLRIIADCEDNHLEYFIIPNFYEIVTGRAKMDEFEDLPILEPVNQRINVMNSLFKRLFDIIFSLVFLVLFSPFYFIIALLIKLDSPGRVIYKQLRAGRLGKPFYVYKFRTMVSNADKIGPKLTEKNDSRITPLGVFLRRWSLDEVPQFINVLKGEMSLVGPRPEVVEIVRRYKSWQKKVLDVKPGLTGYAQVSGRQELEIEPKLKMDLYYINNYSLLMDFEIIFKTVLTVLGGKGAY